LASDLSNIIKEDISNTLESLLSATATINSTEQASSDDLSGKQCIKIETDFEFSKFETVTWKFYIPSATATKFEFLMLGGMTDLKESIDGEISDAMNEIVSNICGSMSTNINAQAFGFTEKITLLFKLTSIFISLDSLSIATTFK